MDIFKRQIKSKVMIIAIDQGIEEQIRTMDMIYDYLADRKIKLSVAGISMATNDSYMTFPTISM